MSKSVTVFGATGTSGGGAMRHLLKAGWKVRAVTRDLNTDKARSAAAAGAEPVAADLDDLTSVRKAIEGADAVYLATPSLGNRWDTGQARQGIGVVDAAAEVGVGHLVYQSALVEGARGVLSVGSKRAIEERIAELELPWTVTRPGLFMDNFLTYFPVQEQDGNLVIAMALPPEKPQGLVSAEDIGRAAVAVLADPAAHAGKAYDLVADLVKFGAMAEIIGDEVGRPVTASPVPLDALKEGWPQGVGLYTWLSTRTEQDSTDTLTRLVGEPIDFRRWVRENLTPTLRKN
ncbi:NmrA family NAD(P)-binding protein [Sphingomonas sp. ID0503]|uniref:NmrA family NAD(P)-binding protein n=1 Tax=Sphingomonas sp. ID0503 TaxID=3399691 RepID=UPI003AFB0989